MATVPNNIMSSLVDVNDSSIITFQEGKDAKERMPEGMYLCITMIEVIYNRRSLSKMETFSP